MSAPRLTALEPEFAAVEELDTAATVSVWLGHPRAQPAYVRTPDHPHYAASTMKLAVMVAAHRLADTGRFDLNGEVPVHAEFASANGTDTYRNDPDYDNDDEPWARLGEDTPLRWLIQRMIVRSSNLATNLVLEQVWRADPQAVTAAWRVAGATKSVTARGIEDYPAREASLDNVVTAADLAALLTGIHSGRIASAQACREMLTVLHAQEVTDDIVRGLPHGTRVAHKNGWIDGVNHSAALVFPDDAPAFVLVTCISAPIDREAGQEVLARTAAAAWADRGGLDRQQLG